MGCDKFLGNDFEGLGAHELVLGMENQQGDAAALTIVGFTG